MSHLQRFIDGGVGLLTGALIIIGSLIALGFGFKAVGIVMIIGGAASIALGLLGLYCSFFMDETNGELEQPETY
jgi:hypothetical protein